VAGVLLVLDNPLYSPLWYPSVGVLTVVAVASGPRAGLLAAIVVAIGYLVGVELHGGWCSRPESRAR
jgi:hypothetical protein